MAWVMVSCYGTPLSWPESQCIWIGSSQKQHCNHSNNNREGVCPWADYEHLSFTPWRNTRRLFGGIKCWFGFFWQWFLKTAVIYLMPVTGCFFSTYRCTSFLLFFLSGIIAYIRVYIFTGPCAPFPIFSYWLASYSLWPISSLSSV